MPLDVGGDAFHLGRGRRSGVGSGFSIRAESCRRWMQGSVARGADRQQNSVPGRVADRAGSRSKTYRRPRRGGALGVRAFAALCRRRCGAHLPPCPNAGASGPRGSRSHVFRGGNQRYANHPRSVFCTAARWLLRQPARWPRPWKYSKVKARWASVKAHGDLPLLPSHARAMKRGGFIDVARNDPRCRAVDIHACKEINRGAEIEADAVVTVPNP